ncbi:MAG: hypothetical protein MMC33_001979 [Icmadophila ericetorum]|nr:hypothetical protein [Icmadophila ericetorum]
MYGSVDEYGASRREPVDRNPSYALDTYIKALKPEEVPLDESLFAHGPRDRIESAHRVTQDRRTTENLTGYNRRPASYPYDTNLDMDEPVVDDPQAARHFAKDRYAIEQNQSTYYVGGGTPFYQPLNEGYQVPRQGSEPRQMNIDSIYATEQGQQYQHYSRFSSSS